MQVRQEHVGDAQAVLLRIRDVLLDVALRVDDGGHPGVLVTNEIRRVGETVEIELPENHATAPVGPPFSAEVSHAVSRRSTCRRARSESRRASRESRPRRARRAAPDSPRSTPIPHRTSRRLQDSAHRCRASSAAGRAAVHRGPRRPSRPIVTSETAAVNTAVPMMPYMWKASNRNISWMRNHETTSASTRMAPNAPPSRKYGTRPMRSPQHHGKHQVRAREPAGEKPAHRQERGRLPIGQTRNGVTRRAATRVRGPEPDEEAADHHRRESLEGEKRGPREHFAWRQTGQIVQSELLQGSDRLRRQRAAMGGGARCHAAAAPAKMPHRNVRFHTPTRFQSYLKNSRPHGATAAHTCLKLLEIPNGLFPSSSNAGTMRPMSGPAMYQGSGCGNMSVMACVSPPRFGNAADARCYTTGQGARHSVAAPRRRSPSSRRAI